MLNSTTILIIYPVQSVKREKKIKPMPFACTSIYIHLYKPQNAQYM